MTSGPPASHRPDTESHEADPKVPADCKSTGVFWVVLLVTCLSGNYLSAQTLSVKTSVIYDATASITLNHTNCPAWTNFYNVPSATDLCDVTPPISLDQDCSNSYILQYNTLRLKEADPTTPEIKDQNGDVAYTVDLAAFIAANAIAIDDYTIHTSISQYAIQTFYDPEHASRMNAFGIEAFNESRLCSTFGYSTDYSASSSDMDGLENFETIFKVRHGNNALTNGTVNWTSGRLSGRNCCYYLNSSFGWTNSVTAANGEDARRLDMYQQSSFGACYACLSHNRNLDGDGNINYDVVRWYLPAIEEYFLISLGENAISNESRLYFGDKSAMTYDGYPNGYLADGAIYYSRSHMLL